MCLSKMVLIKHCFCCSVQIASGFLAAYLLIAYLIAFAFELLWILESEAALPSAAVLLCVGYFAMALFAALLIHGLATKNSVCLLAWLLSVTLLTFPEAGLVIYMSIQYWRLESLFGVTELACWLIRIIFNLTEVILIHSLHSIWKVEDLLHKRIRDLNMVAISVPGAEHAPPLNSQFYQNNGFEHSSEHLNSIARYGSTPNLWHSLPNNMMVGSPYDGYQFYTTSEFNASIFVPNFVNSNIDSLSGKRAHSLMDLRLLEDHATLSEKLSHQYQQPWISESVSETTSAIIPNVISTNSTKLKKFASVDALNVINRNSHIIKNRTGFYAQPVANYGVPIYYGPLDGPDFLIYKKQFDKLTSKNSLTNTTNTSVDDVQKYRDIAL